MNPRLLVLEDDPVCAAFLHEALRVLPVHVDHAPDLATARRLAAPTQSLWIFDARLPDGHGADLLAELRGAGMTVPALALTGEDEPQALARLAASGFAAVLRKPVTLQQLMAAVNGLIAPESALPWDDASALAALGQDPASVKALRQLFLKELPAQVQDVVDACLAGDHAPAREVLHRIKAGCGFVGAPRLLMAVRALDSAPGDAEALALFRTRAAELSVGA